MRASVLLAYIRQVEEFVDYCLDPSTKQQNILVTHDLKYLEERAREIIRMQGKYGRRDILDALRYLTKSGWTIDPGPS